MTKALFQLFFHSELVLIKYIQFFLKKEKNQDSLRDFWDNIKCTSICIIGVPEQEKRKNEPEKIYEEIIAENTLSCVIGNSCSCPESEDSPTQDKLKEEHSETHISQIGKNKRQRENIKSNKRKAKNNIQANHYKVIN